MKPVGTVMEQGAKDTRSDGAEVLAKLPRRETGKRRVEALLDAADSVFVEKGFEGATMTEIAERANASVGSLYQFFPNKDLLADTLRARCGSAICVQVAKLRGTATAQSIDDLVAALFKIFFDAVNEHPSFLSLMTVRGRPGEKVLEIRDRLHTELLALLVTRAHHLPGSEIKVIAETIRYMMRTVLEIALEGGHRKRDDLLRHYLLAISLYLKQMLNDERSAASTG